MATLVEDEPQDRHENEDHGQHDGSAAEELKKEVGHGDHRGMDPGA